MKIILFCWAVITSLALILVLMLNLQLSCTTTAEEMKSAEIACNGEVRHWINAYSATLENFKICSEELRFLLRIDD